MVNATKKKKGLNSGEMVISTEYARVIGIMATLRENIETLFASDWLHVQQLCLMTMAIYVRQTNQCLSLRCSVSCGIQIHHRLSSLMDVGTIFWMVPWPSLPAKVLLFVPAVVSVVMRRLGTCQTLHVVFD